MIGIPDMAGARVEKKWMMGLKFNPKPKTGESNY